MKKLFLSIVLFGFTFIIFNCDSGSSKKQTSGYSNPPTTQKSSSILDKYSYVSLPGKPKEDWVGKYLKIEFDYNGGRSIAGKTKIVQLIDYEKDYEGYKFFTVKDLSDGYLQEVFFFWFGNTGGKNGFGPNIKSWKEAKPK